MKKRLLSLKVKDYEKIVFVKKQSMSLRICDVHKQNELLKQKTLFFFKLSLPSQWCEGNIINKLT